MVYILYSRQNLYPTQFWRFPFCMIFFILVNDRHMYSIVISYFSTKYIFAYFIVCYINNDTHIWADPLSWCFYEKVTYCVIDAMVLIFVIFCKEYYIWISEKKFEFIWNLAKTFLLHIKVILYLMQRTLNIHSVCGIVSFFFKCRIRTLPKSMISGQSIDSNRGS